MKTDDLAERIIRTVDVEEMTTLSRTTIWRLEQEGTFPKRIQLSVRAFGYKESDVLNWINSKQVA